MRRTVAVATAWTAAARPPRSVNHRQTASRSLLRLVLSLFCAACLNAAIAATYPPLTGRINDTAGLINAATRAEIEGKLKDLEDKSGIQLVVVTVKSLEGQAIDPYANELFRSWKLGEKEKSNGALLVIAPNERKVRIEVGYGLEGTLTDAISKIIIANAIVPRFKANDYGGGIARGVDDIITTLTTDSADWQKLPRLRADSQPSLLDTLLPLLVFLIFALVLVSMMRNATTGGGQLLRRGGNVIFAPRGGFGGGFGGGFAGSLAGALAGGLLGGFGGGGGGFSGGGGSSGGGGASGGW